MHPIISGYATHNHVGVSTLVALYFSNGRLALSKWDSCIVSQPTKLVMVVMLIWSLQVSQLVTGFCSQLRSANITADLAVQVTLLFCMIGNYSTLNR